MIVTGGLGRGGQGYVPVRGMGRGGYVSSHRPVLAGGDPLDDFDDWVQPRRPSERDEAELLLLIWTWIHHHECP